MPRVVAIVAMALLALTIAAVPAVAAPLDLDHVLAAAMTGTRAPAAGVLVIRGGKVAGQAVRGPRRNDRPDQVKPDDVWLIGSDAKPMTATLIAQLVDRGRLSWDAPLARLLPDLAATMRPEYRTVTLKDLVSHRSGLPHDVSDMAFFKGFYDDARPLPAQRLAYVGRALQDAPVNRRGTAFSYSNTGFILAAVIAERATGSSYEDLMRRAVFSPLGMSSAGFGVTRDPQPLGHTAGHPATAKDGNPAMFGPAGNIHLSLPDWARFCIDQMAGAGGGGALMSAGAYRLMQTPVPGGEFGLSWGIKATALGRKGPVLTHSGSDGNWYAVVALFPATQDGVLAVANAGEDMGGDKAALAALKAVLPELSTPASPASH